MKKIFNFCFTTFVFLITFLTISFFILKNHDPKNQPLAQKSNNLPLSTSLSSQNPPTTNENLSSQEQADVAIVDHKSSENNLQKFPVCKKAAERSTDLDQKVTFEVFSVAHQEVSSALEKSSPAISLNTEEICVTLLAGFDLMEIQKNYPERKFSQQELKQTIEEIVKNYSLDPSSTEKILTAFESINQDLSATNNN